MSWFIKLLKCILCVEDEERKVSTDWRQYEYQRLPGADSYSRTVPTHSTWKNQSNFAKTSTSSDIPNKWHESSVNLRSTQNRESIKSNLVPGRNVVDKSCNTAVDPCKKAPVVSYQSAAKPALATTKATLSEIPRQQSHGISSLSSSSSSVDVLQTNKANQILNKISKQSSSDNVISASSQRSRPSSNLLSYGHSFKPPAANTKLTPSSFSENSSQYAYKPNDSSILLKPPTVTTKSTPSSLSENSSLYPHRPKDSLVSPKPPPLSTQPTLSPLLSSSTSQQKNNDYTLEKQASTTYVFPMDIKRLIEKDIVPGVLKMPLCPTTYKDYFHALLYAEDYYLEKWDGFEMENVILELHNASIYKKTQKSRRHNASIDKDEKVFIEFDIDKVLERQSSCSERHEKRRARRPFLLSRDFISVKPAGSKIKPFQGVVYRVVKSSIVLAEFGNSFHLQHDTQCEYDVKFSFNRICLKRAHHAIVAASDTLYRNFLFPNFAPKEALPATDHFVNYRYKKESFAVRQILRLQGAPPYLVEGPKSVFEHLSITAVVILEAVIRICRKSPSNRVLLCAPVNSTCDALMMALKEHMKKSDMFRANAAFRDIEDVPLDILQSCLYKEETDCFACPPLEELKKYKVISSTFMSTFRLRDVGMIAGHFSHIFLVDASSATEPESLIPLANFAKPNTTVVVSGAPGNRSSWIRSDIARDNGLRISYFERLRYSELYKNLDPRVITQLEDKTENFDKFWKTFSSFLDTISLVS